MSSLRIKRRDARKWKFVSALARNAILALDFLRTTDMNTNFGFRGKGFFVFHAGNYANLCLFSVQIQDAKYIIYFCGFKYDFENKRMSPCFAVSQILFSTLFSNFVL